MNIWDGIYKNFAQVAGDNSAFHSEKWQESLVKKHNTPRPYIHNEYPLSIAVSMLAEPNRTLRILDFGGGLGVSYFEIVANTENLNLKEYIVVENSNICQIANDCSFRYPNLTFTDKLPDYNNPEHKNTFDIIHIGSSLQYIEKWQDLIEDLSCYNAKYIILSDLMAGDIPTFVSKQYYYGKYIPTWFWNIYDIISELKKHSYNLTFKSLYLGKFFNKEQALPMDNFPKEYRLKHAYNLIFRLWT